MFDFPGWQLLGAFPDNEPDDVGSWLLSNGDDAALLELPPGLTVYHVKGALGNRRLRYVLASHAHEDHYDVDTWRAMVVAFPDACFVASPKQIVERALYLAGEPLWVLSAPKHSESDLVVVFKGTAMTGDIELGMLGSVNDEVALAVKKKSMAWLAGFEKRHNYHIHTIVSAHLNDVRTGVDWPNLFCC